jgi:glycosyltransferase involved in cell wall biosynthesis
VNVWLINPFDPLPSEPAYRPMRYQMLAGELRRRGHHVTWVSSAYSHIAKAYRGDAPEQAGLSTVLIHTSPYRRHISLARWVNHAQYARRLSAWMERQHELPAGIVVSYPLPAAARACLAFGRRHSIPVVVDVQDPWPDVLLEMLPAGLRGPARLPLAGMVRTARQVFRDADSCVTVSRRYMGHAQGYRGAAPFPYSRIYYLGYDRPDAAGRAADALTLEPGALNLTFVGMLGASYDITTLLRAAQTVERANSRVRFLIAGDGPLRQGWEAEAARLGLRSVRFLGYVRAAQLPQLLGASYAGLATYRLNRESVQNKPIEYLAYSLPLISSLRGEFGALAEAEGLGVSYEAGDAASLATAIGRLIGDPALAAACRERAAAVFAERFAARAIYPRYAADLEALFA